MASIWSLLIAAVIAYLLRLPYSDCAAVTFQERPDNPTVVVIGSNSSNVSFHWKCTVVGQTFAAISVVRYIESTPEIVIKLASRFGSNGPNTIVAANFAGRGSLSGTGCETTFVIFNVTAADEKYKYRCLVITQEEFATGYTDDINLDVSVPPSIITFPKDAVAVENGTVNLHCIATGDPKPSVTWSHVNNSDRSFPAGETLTISGINVTDAGEYRCTASSSVGSDSSSATITVIPPMKPSIVQAPRNQSVIESSTVVLFCNASGAPQPSISWTKAGNSTVISVGNKFTLSAITRADAGSYVCTATNHMGTDTTSVWINVNYKPEITNITPLSETWIGKVVTKTCEAQGNPRPTITWPRGGVANTTPLSSTKVRSILSITPTKESDFGVYTCRAENIVGFTEKNTSLVQQTTPSSSKITTTEVRDGKMTVAWLAPTHDGGHAIISYHATLDDGFGTNKTCDTPDNSTSCVIENVSPSAEKYVVTVTAKNGAGDGEVATVNLVIKFIRILFPNEPCDMRITTSGSTENKEKTDAFIKEIKTVYEEKKMILYGAKVKELRCGSIIAVFDLVFSQNETNYLEPLKEATKDGKLGTFTVDKDSVKDYEEPVEEAGFMKFWNALPLGAKVGLIVALCLLVVLIVFPCVMCIIKCRRHSHSGNLDTASGTKTYSNKAYDAETENGVVITKEKELHYADLADIRTSGKKDENLVKTSPYEPTAYAEITNFQKPPSQGEHPQQNGQPKPEPETGKELVGGKDDGAEPGATADHTENGHVDLAAVSGDLQNIQYKPMPRAQMPNDDFMY